MNYRHAYHAGNHADVLKHVVLARVIEHMKKKDKPFRVIDAHAGWAFTISAGSRRERPAEWRAASAGSRSLCARPRRCLRHTAR